MKSEVFDVAMRRAAIKGTPGSFRYKGTERRLAQHVLVLDLNLGRSSAKKQVCLLRPSPLLPLLRATALPLMLGLPLLLLHQPLALGLGLVVSRSPVSSYSSSAFSAAAM